MEVQKLIYNVTEVLAAHNLLQYARATNGPVRMTVGAAMAGLGYVFGPEIVHRMKIREGFSDTERKQLLKTAGGIVLGSIAGYKIGEFLQDQPDLDALIRLTETKSEEQQGGLLTIASAGWLGYTLFFAGKSSAEQEQHLWGLGAGALGYLYAPEVLQKLSKTHISEQVYTDALQIYACGSALVGGVAGGILGWHKR